MIDFKKTRVQLSKGINPGSYSVHVLDENESRNKSLLAWIITQKQKSKENSFYVVSFQDLRKKNLDQFVVLVDNSQLIDNFCYKVMVKWVELQKELTLEDATLRGKYSKLENEDYFQ